MTCAKPVVGFDPAAEGFSGWRGRAEAVWPAPALSRLAGDLLTGGDGTSVLGAEMVTALAPGRLRG